MLSVAELQQFAASEGNSSRKPPLFILAFAISLALLPPIGGRAQTVNATAGNAPDHKAAFPRPSWNLKYRSGTYPLKKNQWLKGAFVSDGSVGKGASPIAVIGRDQVQAIYFNAEAQKDSDAVEHEFRSGCHPANSLMPRDISSPGPGMFVIWPVSLGKMARTTAHLNQRYPIRFVWSDNGVDKEFIFTVDYCGYASFVANLRWFAGPRWQEVGREFPR